MLRLKNEIFTAPCGTMRFRLGATIAGGVLIDSDVLIWALRGHAPAVAKMKGLADWHISAVSYMELRPS